MKLKYLPNLLTGLRLAIIPLFIIFFIKEKLSVCTFLFLVSGLSDAADGFVARRFGCESNLGKILDPIADKLSYASVFFSLFAKDKIPAFFIVGYVILQSFLALGTVFVYRFKKTVVRANILGKLAGLSAFVLCFATLAFYDKLTDMAVINHLSFAVLLIMTGAEAGYFIEYLSPLPQMQKQTTETYFRRKHK